MRNVGWLNLRPVSRLLKSLLAAKKVQRRGWISYSRGVITVLNRTAMEGHVCECYQAVNVEYRRLVGGARVSAPLGPR